MISDKNRSFVSFKFRDVYKSKLFRFFRLPVSHCVLNHVIYCHVVYDTSQRRVSLLCCCESGEILAWVLQFYESLLHFSANIIHCPTTSLFLNSKDTELLGFEGSRSSTKTWQGEWTKTNTKAYFTEAFLTNFLSTKFSIVMWSSSKT